MRMCEWSEWEKTYLTWCDDCGSCKEESGEMRERPYCQTSMCNRCYSSHIEWCYNPDEGVES